MAPPSASSPDYPRWPKRVSRIRQMPSPTEISGATRAAGRRGRLPDGELSSLLEAAWPVLLRRATHMFTCSMDESVEPSDVVQDVCTNACEGKLPLVGLARSSQMGILAAAVQFKIMRKSRDHTRRRELLAQNAPPPVPITPPDEAAVSITTIERAMAAIAELPSRRRHIATLTWEDQRTAPEIADALGIAESTVRETIREARSCLRSQLASWRMTG